MGVNRIDLELLNITNSFFLTILVQKVGSSKMSDFSQFEYYLSRLVLEKSKCCLTNKVENLNKNLLKLIVIVTLKNNRELEFINYF